MTFEWWEGARTKILGHTSGKAIRHELRVLSASVGDAGQTDIALQLSSMRRRFLFVNMTVAA
jgi:hypothetical protein